ncbi:MAG: hypothetical protein AB7O50_03480 [Pseudolabrys sp.]
MNPSAFKDVANAATKTVFVHMTAGDAGLGMGKGGRKHPFYLARDNGAEAAIRFMADADSQPTAKSAGYSRVRGHDVFRIAYRNTVSYFFRVPDGNPLGEGYYDTGFQSLKRLASGNIVAMRAIDGSATYHGWSDLVATVRAIIDIERGEAPDVQINVADRDDRINPRDHSDHIMTAKSALDAVADLSCVRRVHYIDYASSKLPENLSARDRDMESSVFAVTLSGVLAYDHGVSWNHYDQSFVGRNYFRIDESHGPCTAADAREQIAKKN